VLGKGAWIDSVHAAVGGYVNIETKDGVIRNGKLSGLRCAQMKMNGRTVEVLKEIELNGDPTDTVDIWRLSRFDIVGAE
jgi:hypothetical protein